MRNRMPEGKSREALEGEAQALVTCVECGRVPDADDTRGWVYFATAPRVVRRFCPECADMWRAGAPVSRPDDFELSWLVPSLIACSVCGREIAIEEAEAARWGYWNDGAKKFHPFCSECAAGEFGRP